MKRKIRKVPQRQKFHQERREAKMKEKLKDELEDFYWEYTKSPYSIASRDDNYLYVFVSKYYYYCFRPPIDMAFLYNCFTGELLFARVEPKFKELGVVELGQWLEVEAMLRYDRPSNINMGELCYSISMINGKTPHYMLFNAADTISDKSIEELVSQFNKICEEKDFFGLRYLYG